MTYAHVPVMLKEVLEYLKPRSGENFVDATLGGAAYSLALAAAVGRSGKVIGIDLDDLAIRHAQEEIAIRKLSNIILVQDNFKNLKSIVAANLAARRKLDGVVLDLGLSSAQLADETRGFSFKGERPLDMAFGPTNLISTAAVINEYHLLELTEIFRKYGEEREAYHIAKAIIAARRIKKIKTTAELVAIIEKAVPFRFRTKIHPATRIFQALRMETNGELEVLAAVLPAASALLKAGGRLVVVSFHSGEDRIVKRFLKSDPSLRILTKRPLIPSLEEIEANPRSRSAKLRAAFKI